MRIGINSGSVVDVYFETLPTIFRAIIIYTPCVDGDVWILETPEGDTVELQKFTMMIKRKNHNEQTKS